MQLIFLFMNYQYREVWLLPQNPSCMCGQEPQSYYAYYYIPKFIAASKDKRTCFNAAGIQLYTFPWYQNLAVHFYSH